MRRFLLVLALVLVAPAAARAEESEERGPYSLEMAREEAGQAGKPAPKTIFEVPGAVVRVPVTEAVASTRRLLRVAVEPLPGVRGTLRVTLPPIFTRTATSGLRYAGDPIPDGGRLTQTGRELRLRFSGPAAIEIPDYGLPAGHYRLPLSVETPGGTVRRAGTATIRLYAATRDSEEAEGYERNPWAGTKVASIAKDTTADTDEQSETYVTVSPLDPDRIVVGYNDIDDITKGPSVSDDGGATFKMLTQPNDFDARGEAEVEPGSVSGDPMSAADTLGNVWYGGLSVPNGAGAPSRIYVNRIDAKTLSFQPRTVGLDFINEGQQDKPLMTIDNSTTSPTYGRLYVVWDDPGAGVVEAITFCDTRVAGLPAPERCDDADNWSKPAKILEAEGSYIYPDVAVGPDGSVFFTYWDYSANNAIRGAVCRAVPRTNCGTAGSFGAPRDVAVLDIYPGIGGVPFACPTFAAPGGRTGPVPGVDVDISGGPERGRVWVSWGDLRGDSGTTRCQEVGPAGSPPAPTNRTWDVWVASARDDLPGAAGQTSAAVGSRVSTDTAITPTPDNSDDFFPWMAIDQSTGIAYVDYYSSFDDATRGKADFYVTSATATGTGKPVVGDRRKVSSIRSDYSTGSTACCIFGNDYGDYTGIDAAQGLVVPVWTSRANAADDGDALISVPDGARLQLVDDASSIVEGAGADGDGVPEPGEGVTIGERVRNPSTVGATQVQGTLSTTVPGVTISSAGSAYPDIAAAGGTAGNATPFAAKLPVTISCNSRIDFRLALQTAQEPEIVPFTVPVGCNGAIGGVATPPAGTTTPATTGATGTVGSLTASIAITREKLRTILKRGLRVRLRCNERCSARVTMLAGKRKVGSGSVRLTKSGRVSVRIKLTKAGRKRLARLKKVTLTVTAKVTKADGKPGPQLSRKIKLRR